MVQGETWSRQEIESALVIVRQAIHNEIAGQRFYNDAAFACIDPWAKEIFAELAQEEEDHARIFLLEHESLTTQGHWLDLEVARTSDKQVDITRIDFSDVEPAEELFPADWSADQAVDRRADDLAALAFGIQMETQAIALYGQAAETTHDPAAQKTYEFLVEEETQHYHKLKTQWEKLAGRAFDGA